MTTFYHYCVMRQISLGQLEYLDGVFDTEGGVWDKGTILLVRQAIADANPGLTRDPCNFTIISLTKLSQ